MAHPHASGPPPDATTRGFLGVFRYSRRAMGLVWTTNRRLTVALALLTLLAGVLPAAMAWVGANHRRGGCGHQNRAGQR